MADLAELAVALEELKKRRSHESITYVPDDHPKRNQLAFHRSEAWCRPIYGGNRSGKSRAAAQEIYWVATGTHPYQTVPKSPRIWVLSSEYRTLYEGIYLHLIRVLPEWEINRVGPKVPGHEIPSFIELKNGGRIDFISAQGGTDTRRRFQAAEVDLIVVDEEISEDFWVELQARLVSRGGRVIVAATRVESVDWLNDLEDRSKVDRDIFVTYLDTRFNKFNNQKASDRFVSGLSDEEVEVRVLGLRRKSTGLVYSAFNERHLCKPFAIPQGWTKVMCLDPGFRVTAGLWIAISPDFKRYAYRELYVRNGGLPEIVHEIKVKEGMTYDTHQQTYRETETTERINLRFIDPAAYSHQVGGNAGVAITLGSDYQLFFTPAENDKLSNIESVRRWFLNGTDGKPQFYVFDDLLNFQLEIKKYRLRGDKTKRDSDSAPDRPIKKDDHLMNCLEYIAQAGVQFIPGLNPEDMLRQRVLDGDAPADSTDMVQMWKMRKQLEKERETRRSRW